MDCSLGYCCVQQAQGAVPKADAACASTRAEGMWKLSPAMQVVTWKCLGSSPFSFSSHPSLPQLSHTLVCVQHPHVTLQEFFPGLRGKELLPGLMQLNFIAELVVVLVPYAPHCNGNFCIFHTSNAHFRSSKP